MKHYLTACAAALLLASVAAANEPDNTGVNQRDAGGGTLTTLDQGNSSGDLRITAAVREMVVADESLSTNAHNVKIITVDGVVTLRGPVASQAEKAAIETKARSVSGVARVDNQLDVTTN